MCYICGLSKVRGISEIDDAIELSRSNAKLVIGGQFSESVFETHVKTKKGWEKVEDMGWLRREQVNSVLNRSRAGLVTLHPIVNYLDALPVKMFEYMACGIPVIASNFPLWKSIIEDNNCGVVVDPLNVSDISKAIDYIISNPKIAEELGKNGQVAVRNKYNWSIESAKLFALYEQFSISNRAIKPK